MILRLMVTLRAVAGLALAGAAGSMLAMPAMGCDQLRPGFEARVVAVTDGDTVVLDTGDKVRLIGMQAPKLPLGRPDFEAWPLADEAKSALEALSLNQNVEIRFGGAERDRHGRVLGHMFVGQDHVWAQDAMLRQGMARVYTFADNRSCTEDLYRAEAAARADRLGIWAEQWYRIFRAERPEPILEQTGEFALVEGRVADAQLQNNGARLYLNFGADWDHDFTAVMEKPALRMFESAGANPLRLENAFIRVRGWVEDWSGPRIEVTHPEQIEVLAWQ